MTIAKRELGHRVSPLSNDMIKSYAQRLRDVLQISNHTYLRLDVLLEGLMASE